MRNISKIGIRILLIFVVLFLYETLAEFVYRPCDEVAISFNNEREELDGTIETLLCGTSTAQRGFNPKVMDEKLETVSFNIGTSLQPLSGSYYLIKNMAETNPVETVFLTMAPDTMRRDVVATKYKVHVYDRLDGAGNKLAYLMESCDIEEWPFLTLYSVRVEDYFDKEKIDENITTKRLPDYDSGKYCSKYYRGKGMLSMNAVYKKGTEGGSGKRSFSSDLIEQKNVEYLDKIVEYCKENKIELIFVYAPLTEDEVKDYKDFDQVHNYFVELAQGYDVEFWDFNYYKNMKEIFAIEAFQDEKHLNVNGAKVFSEELAKVYKSYHEGKDLSELFLDVCAYE